MVKKTTFILNCCHITSIYWRHDLIKVTEQNESKLWSYLSVCHAAEGRSVQLQDVKVVVLVFFYYQLWWISFTLWYIAPPNGTQYFWLLCSYYISWLHPEDILQSWTLSRWSELPWFILFLYQILRLCSAVHHHSYIHRLVSIQYNTAWLMS